MSKFKIHVAIKSICSALPNTENAKRDMWTPDKKTGQIPVPDMPSFMYGYREIKRYYDVEGYKLYFKAYFNCSDVFKTIEKIWLVYNEQEIALNIFEYMKLKRAVYKKYKKEQIVKTNREFLDKLGIPPRPKSKTPPVKETIEDILGEKYEHDPEDCLPRPYRKIIVNDKHGLYGE